MCFRATHGAYLSRYKATGWRQYRPWTTHMDGLWKWGWACLSLLTLLPSYSWPYFYPTALRRAMQLGRTARGCDEHNPSAQGCDKLPGVSGCVTRPSRISLITSLLLHPIIRTLDYLSDILCNSPRVTLLFCKCEMISVTSLILEIDFIKHVMVKGSLAA